MIISNVKIHTMTTNDVIDNGYIYIKGKKIYDIGDMSTLNIKGEDIIDGNGLDVFPGFIDSHTHVGMFEDGLTFEGNDGNEATEPITPHLRAIDAVNPSDRAFEEALNAGVTTVLTGPGSSNPIAGEFIAIKTHGKRIDKMLIKSPAAIKFALGENPKNVYSEKNQAPCTRMSTAALIRESLFKARQYLLNKESSSGDNQPDYDIKGEALIPLLKRELPAHFHAHRADDMFTAIRISKEFNLRCVIIHSTEGHLIVDELLNEDVGLMSGPFLSDRSKPELKNLTPRSPGVMSNSGLNISIVTDHPVTPIQYLATCASLAVSEGMNEFDAICAITINAARICGIDDVVGTIEVGKDADFVFFSGSPLGINKKPKMVICNGNVINLDS